MAYMAYKGSIEREMQVGDSLIPLRPCAAVCVNPRVVGLGGTRAGALAREITNLHPFILRPPDQHQDRDGEKGPGRKRQKAGPVQKAVEEDLIQGPVQWRLRYYGRLPLGLSKEAQAGLDNGDVGEWTPYIL